MKLPSKQNFELSSTTRPIPISNWAQHPPDMKNYSLNNEHSKINVRYGRPSAETLHRHYKSNVLSTKLFLLYFAV